MMNEDQLETLKEKAALSDRLLVALEDLYNAVMAPASAENVDVLIAARHSAQRALDSTQKRPS